MMPNTARSAAPAADDGAYRRNPFVVHEIDAIHLLLEERRLTFNNRFDALDKQIENLGDTYCNMPKEVAVLQSSLQELRDDVERRIREQEKSVVIALTAADKTTAIAQQTADKAVVKAEAAASREYLEAQITALSNVTAANMISQKEAITAALVSAKEALTAAMAASEKAITKAEEANEKRFSSVNEFRQTLADQQAGFSTKSEVALRFIAIEDKLQTAMTTLSETRGKTQGANWLWGVFVAGVTIVLTIISVTAVVLSRLSN